MQFVIWSPCGYTERFGGVMALYLLAERLRALGHSAGIYCGGGVPADAVVIYPEVALGNPLNAKHVVRWLLNTPGVCGGDGRYGPDDLIFQWSAEYAVPAGRVSAGLLYAYDFHLEYFRDLGLPREGDCYAVRKGRHRRLDGHPPEALCIDDYFSRGGNAYLRGVFNSRRTFWCYDLHTQLSTIAAQCGCQSILVPDPYLSLETWLAARKGMTAGVAYGVEDLPRAEASRPALLEDLIEAENRSWQSIESFVERAA